MLKINSYIIETAYKLSQKSNVERAKFGCLISSGNNILVKGYNASFYGSQDRWTIHAEEMTILRANRLRIFNRYDDLAITVFRFNKEGKRMHSKPCIECLKLIKKFGIDEICYFDNDGEIKELWI